MRELTIIQDGGVLVRDGRIVEVGSMRRMENLAGAREAIEIDASRKVVMPGFVDSHTHLIFPPPGEPADGDRAVRALVSTTAQRLAARSRFWLDAMARHGTTTLEAKTGCGPDFSAELKVLRVLNALHKGALDIVPTILLRPEMPAAEAVYLDLLATVHRRRMARFADFAWNGEPAHLPILLRLLHAARELEFPLKIHADQHACAAAVSLAIEHAAVSIDHLESATPEEARALGDSSTIATLLPCDSFRHRRHAPARALLDAGAALALGTNFNPADSPMLNMQTAISLACLHLGLTPEEAVTAATINSACALHAAHRVGSLEPDKRADILILHTPDYRDLASQLGTNLVHTTIKRGKIVDTSG